MSARHDVLHALVDGKSAAQHEDDECDRVAVEVDLMPISERVLDIRLALRQLVADEEQRVVEASTIEWMPSENMADDPVMEAAMNFTREVMTPARTATTTVALLFSFSLAERFACFSRLRRARASALSVSVRFAILVSALCVCASSPNVASQKSCGGVPQLIPWLIP